MGNSLKWPSWHTIKVKGGRYFNWKYRVIDQEVKCKRVKCETFYFLFFIALAYALFSNNLGLFIYFLCADVVTLFSLLSFVLLLAGLVFLLF